MGFDLEELRKELDKCVRCGACRSICPVLRVTGKEPGAARGKLTLIRALVEGQIDGTGSYIEHLKQCTTCGACKETCPHSIDTPGLVVAARADHLRRKGTALATSLVFKGLLDSPFGALAMRAASALQGVFFKDASAGLLSRFSIPGIGKERLMPALAKTFFLDLARSRKPDDKVQKKFRVAFYAGCGVNYLMPQIGLASLDVLERAGAEVVVPEAQVCCGAPVLSAGDIATAKSLALKNLEVFEKTGADFIVTSCATCGYGLKKGFVKLLGGSPEMDERLTRFVSKVRDITELLAEVKFDGYSKASRARTVTYHDPCHLNRAQGVRSEPRELLKGSPGVEFKEMRFPCSCCGLGGGLGVSEYELSMEVFKRKAESIRDTGAEVVATACPGCIVQIRDGLHKYGIEAEVRHVVELL